METISPVDWGPIYKETIYGRWPVEPWNTATTFFFLIFVIYWSFKIKKVWREQILLTLCLPVIAVGFVGGFLYHSCRNNPLWLILDWGPIVLSALICCLFYWRTIFSSWYLSAAATFLPLIVVIFTLSVALPRYLFLSLGYPLLAVCILTPLFISLRNKKKEELKNLFAAVVCVTMAITLRFLDKTHATDFLPMGSHFLWHTMGALTCHFFAAHNFEHPLRLATKTVRTL